MISLSGIVALLVFLLIFLFTYFLLQAALCYGTIQDLNGSRASVGNCLRYAARFIFPLIGLGFLSGLGIGLATLALVVPGIILTLMWLVTTPVLVVERSGVIGAFSRSSELTRGYRWPLFGLVLIYLAISYGLELLALGVAAGDQSTIAYVVLSAIFNIVTGAYAAVGIAIIYNELRVLQEGVGVDAIAEIFD